MARIPVLFAIGAVAGSVVAYGAMQLRPGTGLEHGEGGPGSGAVPTQAAASPEPAEGTSAAATPAASGYASARLAAFETAAATDDTFNLEALIEQAAEAASSRRRDIELEALLARLAELDPRRAVEIAQVLRLETRLLVPVFKTWAAADAEAAIDELRTIIAPAALRTLALAVLDTLGNDARNVERVASALPQGDRLSFAIDALGERAKRDPSGALTAALASENEGARALAVRRVAEIAANADPRAALAAAQGIENFGLRQSIETFGLRNAYTIGVLEAWAKVDPSAVLAFLETAAPSEIPSSAAVFTAVAASDPERVLAMLDRLPPALRSVAQRTAVQSIAQRNPQQALALLDTLPSGQERNTALRAVSQAYGRQNPEAALAWAKAQSPPSREAMDGVLRGVAEVDFDRALDLVITELEDAGASGTNALVSTLPLTLLSPLALSGGGAQDFERVANRLVAVENPRARSMVSTMISLWSQTDADGALSWTVANAERLDVSALRSLAQRTGQENPTLAASTLGRLPAQHHAAWIQGAAAGVAQNDPNAALRFIEPYRGRPEYAQAFTTVVSQLAQNDPPAAARLLPSAPPSRELNAAATSVAANWARRDPAAAAQFVLTLQDTAAQSASAAAVASVWARSDAEATQRWVLSLPSGQARDNALDGYLTGAAGSGTFDARVLGGYSSDDARQRGASRAIVQLGRTDLEQARDLVATHITNPDLRRQTEEQLARTGGSGFNSTSGTFIDLNGVIFR